MTTHPNVRGRGLRIAALAAFSTMAALAAAPLTQADSGGAQAASETTASQPAESAPVASPSVTSVRRIVPPRRKVIRRRFDPWARPSIAKVRKIIRIEARRWRIDPASLSRRVACESRYQWSANGGAYYGLLQFAPSTFYRGVSSLKTRSVFFTRKRWRKVHEVEVSRYSDGRVVRKRGARRRQKVVFVYRGKLPRRPEVTHAWTQLRIGAQAIRGVSAVKSSEWGCPA